MRISDLSSDVCSSDLIAAVSGLSRSQAHRYLLSYVNTGMVRQDSESGLYELGPLAITIGLAGLRTLEPVRVGGEALVNITNRTGVNGDRKSFVKGTSVSVRVDLGGWRLSQKKKK